MKITFLCSGSKGNCTLLEIGSLRLVIDCGSTKRYLTQALEETGYHVEDFDALLVTHTHSDHISQLKLFSSLPVYSGLPLDTNDNHVMKPGEYFYLQDVKIHPIPLSHDAENTLGFVISTDKEKLVYITDTGYINSSYLGLLSDADIIVMESNHDIPMLMNSNRPQYLKKRIYSDSGHLCNEDCAATLDAIVTPRCTQIYLAHLSEETNTRELALNCTLEVLRQHREPLNPKLLVSALGQFEITQGGTVDEKTHLCRTRSTLGLESCTYVSSPSSK